MKSIRAFLSNWNTTYSDRTKLQHGYAALAVISLIVAGLVSLINYNLGQSLLFIAIIVTLVLIGNGVVWAPGATYTWGETVAVTAIRPPPRRWCR